MEQNSDIIRFNILTSLLNILNYNDEKSTDFVIASYLLNHLDDLEHCSIYKVADDCFVSRSSVQRFIKNIGYDSFTEIKKNAVQVHEHQKSFASYTDHAGYENYLTNQLAEAVRDIADTARTQNLPRLARRIHESRNTVLISADDSAGSLHTFQQAMAVSGKIMRVLTSSSHSSDWLNAMTKEDLLMTYSASGNFALSVNKEIEHFRTQKVLVTLNRTLLFENSYDSIYYLSTEKMPSTRVVTAGRNVYTMYGIQIFLDLLYHEYYRQYSNEFLENNN